MELALQSLLGVLTLPFLVWLCSEDRNAWSVRQIVMFVGVTLAVQLVIVLSVLNIPIMRSVFSALTQVVFVLQAATQEGTKFLFGYLAGGEAPFDLTKPQNNVLIAFQVLPLILVLSALVRLFYHWGLLQRVVAGFAFLLRRGLGISGPLATVSAASIFLGTVEAPLMIRPYLAKMSRGHLFATMVVAMSTVAGTVLAIYASVLTPILPTAAGHLLAASVMNVPGALMMARLAVPEGFHDGQKDAAAQMVLDDAPRSSMDAITQGALEGLRLLATVAAMLIVIVALVALVNAILAGIGAPFGWTVTLQGMLGVLLSPIAWLIGVPWSEAAAAGSLLGQKLVLNEFIAYFDLAKQGGSALSERTRLLLTYALCGFANLGSLGIMIGGFSAMVPERRDEIVSLAPKAVLIGFLVTLLSAALVGVTQFG